MVNDQLSDFVARVRNGYLAKKEYIEVEATKMVGKVAEVLCKSGYLTDIKQDKDTKKIIIGLKYEHGDPAIMGIRRVSRPGVRIYTQVKDLPRVWGGLGINILSTPKGILTDREAKKLHSGGELLIQVW